VPSLREEYLSVSFVAESTDTGTERGAIVIKWK
jgi:hypothetical protein